MFECPHCHYRDSPYWRNSRFIIYAVYCTLEEFSMFEPDLAAKLKQHKEWTQPPYYYYLRGTTPHVYRIHMKLKNYIHGHGITEKPKPKDPTKPLTTYLPKQPKKRH